MNIGMYGGAASMTNLHRWQEALTRDIASAHQAGYRKMSVGISGTAAGKLPSSTGQSFQSHLDGAMPESKIGYSFEQGSIEPTGDPFDFAISGDGFFQLQEQSGRTILTRGGHFGLNTERQVVDNSGNLVLGSGGPIQLNADQGDVYCDMNGRLYQGDTFLDQLGIVDLEDKESLIRVPGGFIVDPESAAKSQAVEFPRVQQGFIEGSNASIMESMVGLMEVSRAQESSQKLINILDERAQRSLKILGND